VPLLRDEGIEVVVATTTDTGLARAKSLFADSPLAEDQPGRPGVRVVRYALDLSASVRRFLDAVRPDAVALVELEIWPNFVRECTRRNIPVAVINGRLSARSFKGYHRFHRFLSPSFGRLAFAAVQDSAYAERFRTMGARDVRITGSMKWDAVTPVAPGPVGQSLPEANALAAALGIDRTRPLIVAGSTGPGATKQDETEEQLLHRLCPPGVQLLCAPRRPERFDEAYGHLGGTDRCVRRSATGVRPAKAADRFLLDSIGELRAAYALADVVVVGRTFSNLRGSDPIEPIALGKATVIGPDYANFTTIVDAFRAADALVVTTANELGVVLSRLLNDPARREQLAAAGLLCIAEQKGATATHARMLTELARRTA
jgi:3-deoxy-D-manno-octulosonic-acid transferase